MSRSAAELRRSSILAPVLLGLSLLGAGRVPASEPPPPSAANFELTRGVRQSLERLQEHWLQWNAAFVQDHAARGAEATRQILTTVRQLGFTRVEDLARGAAARAIESAASGNWPRARWALESAEALDPGQAMVPLAGAIAAWKAGRIREALGFGWKAVWRLGAPPHREVHFAELKLWLLLWWVLVAVTWILASLAVWASALVEDLRRWLAPALSSGVGALLVALLLSLPLLLPGGPLWVLLWVSVWLWPYHSRVGKALSALAWLALGLVPGTADRIRERLDSTMQPPVRALNAFAEGRLYGGFLSDLQVLRSALPLEPAALELLADVHRTLGQWELARSLYAQVLEREPANAAVLLNLGGYFFRKGDFGRAVDYYRKAAEATPESAAAYYNLSMAFSDNYLFDDAREALDRARQLDAAAVDSWVRTPPAERVLTFNGSTARLRELELLLGRERRSGRSEAGQLRQALAPATGAAAAAVLALGVSFLRRNQPLGPPAFQSAEGVEGWLRTLLPPIATLADGASTRAFAWVVLLAGLLLLPLMGGLLAGLSWGGFRPAGELAVLSLILLLLALGSRILLRLRGA